MACHGLANLVWAQFMLSLLRYQWLTGSEIWSGLYSQLGFPGTSQLILLCFSCHSSLFKDHQTYHVLIMLTSEAQELVSLILQMLFKTLLMSGHIDISKSQTKPRHRELNLPTVGKH